MAAVCLSGWYQRSVYVPRGADECVSVWLAVVLTVFPHSAGWWGWGIYGDGVYSEPPPWGFYYIWCFYCIWPCLLHGHAPIYALSQWFPFFFCLTYTPTVLSAPLQWRVQNVLMNGLKTGCYLTIWIIYKWILLQHFPIQLNCQLPLGVEEAERVHYL